MVQEIQMMEADEKKISNKMQTKIFSKIWSDLVFLLTFWCVAGSFSIWSYSNWQEIGWLMLRHQFWGRFGEQFGVNEVGLLGWPEFGGIFSTKAGPKDLLKLCVVFY